mgnify:CR=1 FL=1
MSKTKKRVKRKLKRGGSSLKKRRINVTPEVLNVTPEVNEDYREQVRQQLFKGIEQINREQELLKEAENARKEHGISIQKINYTKKLLQNRLSSNPHRFLKPFIMKQIAAVNTDRKRKIEESPYHPYYNTVNVFNNFEQFAVGFNKIISKPKINNGWAYIRPIVFDPILKAKLRDQYKLELLLCRVCPKYFPQVEFVAETALMDLTRKELCVEIVRSETLPDDSISFKGNLSREMLTKIIDTAIELLDNYGLFTLDFVPSNMGLLNGRIVFIDVDPARTYLVQPNYDTTEYKNVIVLILLVHSYRYSCVDCELLTHNDLRDLARLYVRDKNYHRLISKEYNVETDQHLVLAFNEGIAPSVREFITPLTTLNNYTAVHLDTVLSYLLDS